MLLSSTLAMEIPPSAHFDFSFSLCCNPLDFLSNLKKSLKEIGGGDSWIANVLQVTKKKIAILTEKLPWLLNMAPLAKPF